MTSQGTASGRFTRAIQQRHLFQAEMAMREMRGVSLLLALDYLTLLAEQRPDRFDLAALRWHGRPELEARSLSLADSQLALAALGSLRSGDKHAAQILTRILHRAMPRTTPRGPESVDGE